MRHPPTLAATGTSRRARLSAAGCEQVFARLAAGNPHPTTELCYGNAFQLLIAVILSAQSTDRAVNKATRTLFAVAPDAQAMLALGEEVLKAHINTIGLYNTKARQIMQTCTLLLRDHGGAVPADRAALESLPGVGRKTANVVLNTAFGVPTIAVDTHIFRVANRLGLAPGGTVRAVEEGLLRRVPERFRANAHHWLILHGRYVCKARAPACDRCVLFDLCPYPDKVGVWTASGSPQGSGAARAPNQKLPRRRSPGRSTGRG